ncbi:DUF397 domain-containing protein [Streptomyces sp. NPDC002454]|uniref:DUF397 domain-containing protein n=1 Tax=Streptomyces sp. NPDC049906 TaxID=3155656 RepID=UPI0034207DDA
MTQPHWHISTYSTVNNDCVEVAVFDTAMPGVVRVRDSKDRAVPEIQASATAWHRFLRPVQWH